MGCMAATVAPGWRGAFAAPARMQRGYADTTWWDPYVENITDTYLRRKFRQDVGKKGPFCICFTVYAWMNATGLRGSLRGKLRGTFRGKNGIIHAMKTQAKTALSLALAIVGGIND